MTKPDPPDHAERVAAARLLEEQQDRVLEATGRVAGRLVGLTATTALAQVDAEGLVARVVDLDDPAGGWLTADLRLDRVTLYLRGSVVERAVAG